MANKTLGGDNALSVAQGIGSSANSKLELKLYTKRQEAIENAKYIIAKKYGKKFEELDKSVQETILKRAEKMAKGSWATRLKDAQEYYTELAKYDESFSERLKASAKATGLAALNSLGKAAKNAANYALNGFTQGIDAYLGTYTSYMSGIETRLLGSSKSFKSTTDLISKNIGSSAYVRQTQVLENLSNLVQQGIVYNVEQRAFLATVSDKIAVTFDSFDSNMLRLIRIQQADSTAARLGMESTLNKFFNNMYSDTSYLNNLSSSVSEALLEASSQLSRDGALELEYVVQKWLGSMSSVGVSDNTISMLAQGIGYLGSGNVSALSSNSALQNLLVMAANEAGKDYASILTGGANAGLMNQLLSGVVKFGQKIADNSNYVVKSQYAQLFGMTVSDLTSLLNLSSEDLVKISNNMLKYSSAVRETENQISSIGSRISTKEKIDNLLDNVMASVGEGIGSSAGLYTTWLVNNMIEQATGGINIPFISAMGSGIDLNANINQIAKLGIAGIGLLANVSSVLNGLNGRNNLTLNNWGADATTGRGSGLTLKPADTNLGRTISQSYFAGTPTTSELYENSITSAEEQMAETVTGTEESNPLLRIIRDSVDINVAKIVTNTSDIKQALIDLSNKISSSGYTNDTSGM